MIANRLRQVALIAGGILTLLIVAWAMKGRSPKSFGSGQIWTCSMHPQIRMDHPDVCPICGMDLTPVTSQNGDSSEVLSESQLVLSDHAGRMAGLESVELIEQPLFKELRTVGKVEYDETALTYVTARITGRVEEVFASFPGTAVRQGDHLVSIYSPDLLATQSEFLDAARREQIPRTSTAGEFGSISSSAKRRLELWGITPAQIDQLLRSGKPDDHLVIYAPFGGTIVEKNVRPGQYVETGEVLYRLANLDRIWLILEIFESDMAWIRFGQAVDVTLEGFPEHVMTGSVAFVEPVLNEDTRTVRVRVVLPNLEGRLRPGMYAQALLKIAILANGEPGPTGLEGKFVCPMHPYIVAQAPGECSVCRMPLEQMSPLESPEPSFETLAIPADAVLTTGRRQLVYVDRGEGQYELVAPHLGPRAGDYYPVLHGLEVGDRVVRRGNFLLDSQFQISGKPSLLYPEAMHSTSGAHDHEPAPETDPNRNAPHSSKIESNLRKLNPEDRQLAQLQATCPITGLELGSMGVPVKVELNGVAVLLCCGGCKAEASQKSSEILERLPQTSDRRSKPNHDH